MEEQNNSNSNQEEESEIKDGDLLNIANNILSLLNYSQKLDNEEDLFLDDFYVSIIGNLLSDNQPEISPGETLQEKAEIMNQLVLSLSQAIEVDLSHINGAGIILNHDKVSAKNLLDVISELIKTIIDNNLEEVQEEKNEENDKNFSESKKKEEIKISEVSQVSNVINTGENNDDLNKKIKEYQIEENNNELNNENEIENDNMKQSHESSSNNKINSSCFEPLQFQKLMNQMKDKENKENDSYIRQTYSQNDISRYERNREFIEINQENNNENNYQKEDAEENDNNNINAQENVQNESPIMNVSDIDNKEIELTSGKKTKNKIKKPSDAENYTSNKKKKSNEIPDLINSEEKKIESSQKKTSNKKDKKNLFDKEDEKIDLKDIENPEESEIDLNYSENKTANSMPPGFVKINLEEESERKENKDSNIDRKKTDSIFDDSHIIKGSQMDKSNRFNDEEEEFEQEEYEINNNYTESKNDSKLNNSSQKKKYIIASSNKSNSKQNSKMKNKNIQKLSSPSENDNQKSSQKKSQKLSNQKNLQNSSEPENNIIEENSQKSSNNNNNKTSSGENIQMDDDQLKYQIMKEFYKIYGDKLDYLFLKQNTQLSPNLIELALRNIKLAKEKMQKINSNIPPKDDPKILEYLQKYEKELEFMLLNYNKDQKKFEITKEREITNYSKSIKHKQKIDEIEKMKTDNELDRRQRAKDVRNYHNKIKFSNKIYKDALEQEKIKNLENIKYQKEIINKENEEKRKAMITIEKFYKDQIKMLKEILAKEKKERDMEHRAYMIILNQKEREAKEEYKKQLNEIFQKFDEEDRIEQYENENNPEIKRIFDAYYGF